MSTYDPTDIRAQDRARADAATQRRLSRDTEESDLKWLVKTKQGRRVVWRLLEQAGVFRMSFNTNSMQMAFNEGNRSYGNRVMAMLHTHCPEAFVQMMNEARAAEDNETSK